MSPNERTLFVLYMAIIEFSEKPKTDRIVNKHVVLKVGILVYIRLYQVGTINQVAFSLFII